MRPIRIEPAIIMPGVISPSIANQPPSPSTRDCKESRTNLVMEVTRAERSLAIRWLLRNLLCRLNQRRFKFGNIPNASITSALRKLVLARLLDIIYSLLASPSGLRDSHSFNTANPTSNSEPTNAKRPSHGLNRKITSK